MGTWGDRDSKVYQEFLSEAEELLERMRSDLANLEDQINADRDVDPELVNGLFRSAHSLKGLSSMFGIDGLRDLAHRLEDLLDSLRNGRVAFDSSLIALIPETVDLFGTYLLGLGETGEEVSAEGAISEMTARLQHEIEAAQAQDEEPLPTLLLDPTLLGALTEYEEHRLRENIGKGKSILLVEVAFEILSFDEGLSKLTDSIREMGEVVSTLPARGAATDSQFRFLLLVATDLDAPGLARHVNCPNSSITSVLEEPVAGSGVGIRPTAGSPEVSPPPSQPLPTQTKHEAGSEGEVSREQGAIREPKEITSLRSISDTVRVDIRKLDQLMNLVGELAMCSAAIAPIARSLQAEADTVRQGETLEKVDRDVRKQLKELQSGVLELRLVPLHQVFEKLSRVVRKMNRELSKNVSLELSGIDTELDKLMVEQLADPLLHIVRNAFDHGIEASAERTGLGKPADGRIAIDAFQRGNHVVIEIRDDGRGIDTAAVRRRAIELKLIDEDEEVGEKNLLDLVFYPGLSTNAQVTEISGRGVGMDVVHENIKKMGGLVSIESKRGEGTAISITLPVTLAIIQSLLVEVSDQIFAIPLTAVIETLFVESSEIQHSEGAPVLSLRGEMLLLRKLREEFDLGGKDDGEEIYVVVVGLGERRLGLVVDRLYGQRDTVMRSIRGPVREIRGIAGATEMPKFGAVLIVDVAAIIEDSSRWRGGVS